MIPILVGPPQLMSACRGCSVSCWTEQVGCSKPGAKAIIFLSSVIGWCECRHVDRDLVGYFAFSFGIRRVCFHLALGQLGPKRSSFKRTPNQSRPQLRRCFLHYNQ